MTYDGPYIENPDDVFNPVVNAGDWLEIIDSGASPSSTSLTRDGQNATLTGYIPWNKQRSAARWFLGFACPDADFNLQRENPDAHPLFPWLYAGQVDFTPFNPMANDENEEQPLQFVSPFFGRGLVGLNVANHRLVICKVTYHACLLTFLDDSDITDPRMEWMRNVNTELAPSTEELSADGIGQLTFAETGIGGGSNNGPTLRGTLTPGTPFPAPLAVLLGKADLIINWLDVPVEFLSNEQDYFWPENIMTCLGQLNSDNFPYGSSDPFLPGQLLFDSVRFTRKIFPVSALDPASPLISIDVAMTMKYFSPPKGNANSAYVGHNLMPWRGDPGALFTSPSDPTAGKFFYATRGGRVGDNPLLTSVPFANLFLSPNA